MRGILVDSLGKGGAEDHAKEKILLVDEAVEIW